MKIKVSSSFYPLFDIIKRYLLLYGGAGSGKSEFAGRKVFKRCMEEGGHRFLIMRKVRKTLQHSVIEVMLTILNENEVEYSYNKSDRIIRFFSPNGKENTLLFEGLDDREKIKSIKGITSVWLEEATEFTEQDFIQIDLRLRGKTEFYKQIILTFNPDEAQAPWIKEAFFFDERPYTGEGKKEDSYLHHSAIADNPIGAVKQEYQKVLDRIKDSVYRSIYRSGIWALARGIIFDWDVVDLPTDDWDWYDEIFYGGDFGFSVDPAAVVRIYRKANEYWIEEVIYETRLTNIALGKRMEQEGITEDDITYWDSAEPKSIQELYDMGFDARPAIKGPDSVKAGIDFLLTLVIHIVKGSHNIIAERKAYKRQEDKDGNILVKPVEYMNHAMSAIRYGIYTHMKDYADSELMVL